MAGRSVGLVATHTVGGPSPDPDHLHTVARLADAAGQPAWLLHLAAVKVALGSSSMQGGVESWLPLSPVEVLHLIQITSTLQPGWWTQQLASLPGFFNFFILLRSSWPLDHLPWQGGV